MNKSSSKKIMQFAPRLLEIKFLGGGTNLG